MDMNFLQLKDVCKIVMGQSPDSSSYNDNNIGIPFFQGNADFGDIYPNIRLYCNSPKKTANSGDILMSVRAPIGALNYANTKCCIGRGLAAIIPYKGKVSKEYIFWLLKCKNVELNNKGTGSTFKAIGRKVLEEILVPDISLEKQLEISKTLDKIYNIIQTRRKELDKLDELVKARFVEMFEQGDYPITTISKIVSGKVSTAKKDFAQTDIIKYIDISSIDNKHNAMTGYTEYVLSEAPSRAQQHIKKGDILVSTVRPKLKNVAITSFEDDNLVASSGFCVLRANECLPEYLLAIVVSDKFTDDMTNVVTGANYPAIKDSDVMNYPVYLPPIELQNKFANFVKQIDKSKFIEVFSIKRSLL